MNNKANFGTHIAVVVGTLAVTLVTFQTIQVMGKNLGNVDQISAATCDTSIVTLPSKYVNKPKTEERPSMWSWFKREKDDDRDDKRGEDRDDDRREEEREDEDRDDSNKYKFNVKCLTIGEKVYRDDQRFTFYAIPPSLAGSTYIQTSNRKDDDDKSSSWSFNVNKSAEVYVLYRKTTNTRIPNWINDAYNKLTPDALTLDNQSLFVIRKGIDGKYGAYDIYKLKNNPMSGKLEVGKSSSNSNQSYSMYIMAIKPVVGTTSPAVTASPAATPQRTVSPTPRSSVAVSSMPTSTPQRTASPSPTPVPTPTPTPTPSPSPSPTQTPLQIVSSHNTQSNCWTVYNGGIYNLTGYFGMHPAGNSSLVKACGKDMTSSWDRVSSHSGARTILESYKIQ